MISARAVRLILLPVAWASFVQAQDPARFKKQIDAYLEADKTTPPPKNAILFIGSSIFRQWAALTEQMAPLPVFNRAFGGSQTPDVLHYMDALVLPHAPRLVVYYCGGNDVNAGRDAETIFTNFKTFAERVRAALPETRIFYVSIIRAPDKQNRWGVVDRANALARAYCERAAKLKFIDVNPAVFGEEGNPRIDLYLADGLHYKAPAYVEFTAVIKPILAAAWSGM